jgi:hypothetical protein
MNWRDTTPMPSDAGARLLAPVRRADWLPGRSSLDSATTASELDEGVALVPSDDEGGRRFPRPARIRSDRVKSRFGENRVRSPLIDHFPQAPVAHSAGVQLLLRDAAPSLPAQVNPELTCSLDGHFQSSVSARMLSWSCDQKSSEECMHRRQAPWEVWPARLGVGNLSSQLLTTEALAVECILCLEAAY